MTPGATRPVVNISRAGKRYGRRWALSRVDLVLQPGEVLGFIGPNGAGKTTLIKLLAGLVRPTEGQVEVLDEDLAQTTLTPEGLGLVQESPSFIPYLPGRKNLALLASIRNVASLGDIDEALDTVGLDPSDRRPVRAYSFGMRQRLGLAQALMERPRLLLLDEPTNGLDPQGIMDLRTLIRRLADDGVAIFLASHLLTEVEQLCDRVLLVQHGQVRKQLDQHWAGRTVVQLTVSAQADLAAVDQWASETGTATQTAVGSSLTVEVTTDTPVPDMVRELVAAGVSIEAISKARRSLEREFAALAVEGER